jgi:hypothetical protein
MVFNGEGVSLWRVQEVVVIEPGLPLDIERPGRRIEYPPLLLVGLR